MELKITSYEFGERPEVTKPDIEFYNQMGEDGIREMVSRHYDLLRESSLKEMFPKDESLFEIAKQNSSDFFIQICGGPDYFNQHRGKPMMSNSHSPFSITPEGRVVWLNCYKQAIIELNIPDELKLSFWNYIDPFSNWIVNTPTRVYRIGKK